jgi:uncharacterized RDD family membrane protein YckC
LNVYLPPRYAGLVTRAVAFLIDAAIVNGVALAAVGAAELCLSMFGTSLGDLPTAVKIVFGAGGWIALNLLYFVGSWTITGQTAGNRVMSIRVEATDGALLSIWRAIIRLVGVVLAAIPLFAGFLPILVSDRRRGLQDWLAGSVVVFRSNRDVVWGGPLKRRMTLERKQLSAGDSTLDRVASTASSPGTGDVGAVEYGYIFPKVARRTEV